MNQINLIGRITKNLELKTASNGNVFLGFTIAVSEHRKDGEHTNFIPCIAFNHTAENMNKYLGKGSLISVEGRLQVRSSNKEGKYENIINVAADRVHFLESQKVKKELSVEQNNEVLTSQFNNNSTDENEDYQTLQDSILWD
ncbi:single-strand DNA-binding protein [Williamsoniiplasma luminosum]|uniref:Single-stranded DNA-binding protein n=1 Tax=Williamsoniiplasma luminosum TaxID=214888 RepID=A0A2K8NTW8_9MOLU|nr:single-stranded DNA-binding protein [Williamsoniiplasma luminosum]ATZ17204.1 single-strand DNA-binding protein [Williamsoniiplasma luminosum]